MVYKLRRALWFKTKLLELGMEISSQSVGSRKVQVKQHLIQSVVQMKESLVSIYIDDITYIGNDINMIQKFK